MVEEALSNYGLFIDDENRIRLIDPERLTDSAELRDECKDFIDSKHGDFAASPRSVPSLFNVDVLEFKTIVDTLIEKTEQYSKQVEAERLKVRAPTSATFPPSVLQAIGAKNMLKSAGKYREFEKQQLQSVIREKAIEFERSVLAHS